MFRPAPRRLFAMLVFLFACAPLTHAADTATFSLWHSFRGDEANALETVVATFNEQNADKIRLVHLDGHRFTDEVESALAAGRGPDLMIWAHDKVGPWVEKGWITPIDDLVPADELEVFIPSCLNALKYQGRLYGLPLSFETLILYYNKNLVSSPPKTTDELIEMARAATDTASGRYGLVYERGIPAPSTCGRRR
jgi:maltose-binding protein MalE